jgi:HTH-type transcriptional regulator/antitoxin HigA
MKTQTPHKDIKVPFMVFHPGETLQDELDERGITQTEFAEIIDRPTRTVNEIVNSKRAITPETAQAIAAALGTSPEMWLKMQARYDVHELAKKENKTDEVKERASLYERFPISDLIRRGYLPPKKSVSEIKSKLAGILEIPSLDVFDDYVMPTCHRTSKVGDIKDGYLKTWVLLGRRKAEKIKVGKFDAEKLKEFAGHIKKLSFIEGGEKKLITQLQEIGVRVVFLSHFAKTRVDGAVTWVDGKPIIILSLRYDRIDNFYFTLLHEIGHIVKHPGENFEDDLTNRADSKKEDEADAFASKALGLEGVSDRLGKIDITAAHLTKISKENEVHVGLLIGHLQHENILGYHQFRKGLPKIKGELPKELMCN